MYFLKPSAPHDVAEPVADEALKQLFCSFPGFITGIMEWFQLEGTFKDDPVQLPAMSRKTFHQLTENPTMEIMGCR